MKNKILLLMITAGLFSCSKEELALQPENLNAVDLQTFVDQCAITSFNFGDAGTIFVRNDRDFIYYSFTANSNFTLSQVSLHYTSRFDGFPTNKGGIVQAKNFVHQKSFEAGVVHYEYKLPVSSYGNDLLIASNVTFLNQEGLSGSLWAGDKHVPKGNWLYFVFNVQVPPYNAGADKSGEISLSAAKALPSVDEVRKTYTAMLDPGVPQGQFVGSFKPTIKELVGSFNGPSGGVGDYPTVYTLGNGECTDSVTLTLKVVADEEI